MKIAHLITRLIIGGAQENTVLTVEDHIQQSGDQVLLLTGPALGPEGSLLPRAAQSGCDLVVLDSLRRSLHPWRDWQAYRDLKRELKRWQPDIIHTHSSKAGILGRYLAHTLKIPCVHTIHGAAFHFGQPPWLYYSYRQAEKWTMPWADHVISVADAMTTQYLQAGIGHPEHYTTISSGFAVEPFLAPPVERNAVRTAWGLSPEHVAVGKIARLFPLKGHDSVLAVAERVIHTCPQVRFVLIGDGILRESFQTQIQAMGLQDHFIFTGLVPPTEIPRLMQGLDAVVHTSQWEGLARVLPQALIAGKPVVSFDIDGAREVVLPGETGFLVPRNDLDQLAEALKELTHNAALRHKLGSTGREKFTEQFRHQTMSRRIREIYQQVLQKRA